MPRGSLSAIFVPMKLILCLLLFFYTNHLQSQNRNSVWCFGDSAGIDFSNINSPSPYNSTVRSRGSCVSIADTAGNLMCYAACSPMQNSSDTTTVQVYNSTHQIIQNGDSIVGLGWFNELVLLPKPDYANIYYLFSIGVSLNFGIYYSVIDMNQNGGLGSVIQKNIQLQSFACDDGLTAIKHGNGRDWWLFFRSNYYQTDTFFSYLFTPQGIQNFSFQRVGHFNIGYRKQIVFSSDGSKMIATNYAGLIELYDFDRCSGIISNPRTISIELQTPYLLSAAFSPNDSIMYVTTNTQSPDTSYLFQFNLYDTNIYATKDTIHTFTYPPSVYEAGFIKLGPDGKIYVPNAYYNGVQNFYPFADSMYNSINMNLSVINQPNKIGSACDFQLYSFYLGGKRAYAGLPNNPDYNLGPDTGNVCDTLLYTSLHTFADDKTKLNIYYHEGWNTAFINAQNLLGKKYTLTVFDFSGRCIFREEGDLPSNYFYKNLICNFANGLYIVTFLTDKEVRSKKFRKNN